ncbi:MULTISPECIES: hypothetical protein [unclassified Lysinibacillus]
MAEGKSKVKEWFVSVPVKPTEQIGQLSSNGRTEEAQVLRKQ